MGQGKLPMSSSSICLLQNLKSLALNYLTVSLFFLFFQVTCQEAVDVVRPLCIGVDKPEPFCACKKLAQLSIRRGSTDDISVMVIQLSHFLS